MNWHNGFIRIWIVMSAAWVGMIGWNAYGLTSAAIGQNQLVLASLLLILKYLALAILPPLAIAVVGILMWLNALVLESVFLRFPAQPGMAPVRRTTVRETAGQRPRRRDPSIGRTDRPRKMS